MSKDRVGVMKQKLLTLTSYYSDIHEYSIQLIYLEDKYDETLECYNLDEYMHGGGEKRTQIAQKMLLKTTAIFEDLCNESEAELYDIYQEICSLNEDEQISVWGKKRELIENELMKKALSEEFQYQYVQEDALQEFLRVIDGIGK